MGESGRFNIHRQSGAKGKSIQTGLPIAPARWATAVSTEITRSRLAISAAVSAKSVSSEVQSIEVLSLLDAECLRVAIC